MLKVVGDHWLPEENPLPSVIKRRRNPLLVGQSRHQAFLTDVGAGRRLPYAILTPRIFMLADGNANLMASAEAA
jgi:hypothetical protein